MQDSLFDAAVANLLLITTTPGLPAIQFNPEYVAAETIASVTPERSLMCAFPNARANAPD